ncbi:hypothetical protein N9112_00010 [bacterium]|nr:hypothetical protein [bacterium]
MAVKVGVKTVIDDNGDISWNDVKNPPVVKGAKGATGTKGATGAAGNTGPRGLDG